MKDRLNDRLLRAAVMTIGMGMLWATSLPAARADCLDDAANYWSVPTSLARAVAMQESGMRPRVVSKNTNGSRDIGLMQINSSWLPRLKQYGIGEEDLLDACKNAGDVDHGAEHCAARLQLDGHWCVQRRHTEQA